MTNLTMFARRRGGRADRAVARLTGGWKRTGEIVGAMQRDERQQPDRSKKNDRDTP